MAAALIVFAGGTSAVVGTEPASAAPACAKAYQVVKGDSWFSIAKKSSVSQTALYQANQASAASPLYPGGSVCLPDTATVPTTTTTVPGATTTTTIAPAVTLAAFPAQGPCWYTDTWQAPRGGGRLHEGVDIIAKAGQFIYAAIDGTLTRQQLDRAGSLSGNAWWLTGADGTYVFYAHLSAFAPDLAVGSKVVAGQVIGWIGRTGNAAGPHLHFEVHPKGGAPVNPTPIVRAVDGCTIKEPPPQPSGSVPPAPASTLPPASQTGGKSISLAIADLVDVARDPMAGRAGNSRVTAGAMQDNSGIVMAANPHRAGGRPPHGPRAGPTPPTGGRRARRR